MIEARYVFETTCHMVERELGKVKGSTNVSPKAHATSLVTLEATLMAQDIALSQEKKLTQDLPTSLHLYQG